jgi:hypothetical protein
MVRHGSRMLRRRSRIVGAVPAYIYGRSRMGILLILLLILILAFPAIRSRILLIVILILLLEFQTR